MEPDQSALLGLFLETALLKRVPRTGWAMRGVPHVESVAEHSFGVAFMALMLATVLNDDAEKNGDQDLFGVGKVMTMALLHDLAEVRLTDLPASAVRLIADDAKSRAEEAAIRDLLAPLPSAGRWQAMWGEFEQESSPEGRLVRDADKLEMMVQCLRYERAGSRGLEEFWQAMDQRKWHLPISEELYAQLRRMRPVRGEE